jgi:AcrR family transcriptional regulator/DNA-binding MarR family transcriptional regulator
MWPFVTAAMNSNLRTEKRPTEARALRKVREFQRARIVAAAIDVLGEGGYEALTVSAVLKMARISRKTFYEIFENRQDCLVAVMENIFERAHAVASAACAEETDWLVRTRAALGSLLMFVDEEPTLARIWIVEASGGPEVVLAHRARVAALLAEAIERGSAESRTGRTSPGLAAEAVVGGILHVVRARLEGVGDEPLAALLGPLMFLVALPYLGVEQAQAELRRATPQPPRRVPDPRVDRDFRRGVQFRLTYRTIRALAAISERPGASNRQVAAECGIRDQGQISKLLSRLERVGLVENQGIAQDVGRPNAWHITQSGSRIMRATDLHEFLRAPSVESGVS